MAVYKKKRKKNANRVIMIELNDFKTLVLFYSIIRLLINRQTV